MHHELFIINLTSSESVIESVPKLRILGGHGAYPGQFPYHVSIQKRLYGNANFSHICGGSIIDEKWILTAAHCLLATGFTPSNKHTIKVKAGRFDISKDYEDGEQVAKIHKIFQHDSFDRSNDSP